MTPFPAFIPVPGRVVLRPLTDTDVDDLLSIFGDPEVVRYWSGSPWSGREEARRMLGADREAYAAGAAVRLGVTLCDEDRVVGTVSLFNRSEPNRRAEIGYALARSVWGRGLMHETLVQWLGWAFGPLGLHRLEADVDPANMASRRSLERLGFRQEGLLRERWIVGGAVADTVFYGLLAQEWRAGTQR
ncbi:GNAT family N-acetyltransferase [Dyella lutea]|uniref:GNAT family N-acetyltransferase n=1 Tax=Dyella lutea TaxID=2950441 RepID=A0ABT1F9D6_9GAMM|nr:GNAT family N-acetyltransferase [Dyella lutea]